MIDPLLPQRRASFSLIHEEEETETRVYSCLFSNICYSLIIVIRRLTCILNIKFLTIVSTKATSPIDIASSSEAISSFMKIDKKIKIIQFYRLENIILFSFII